MKPTAITIDLQISDETIEKLGRLNDLGVTAARVINPEPGDKVIFLLSSDSRRYSMEQIRSFKEIVDEVLGFPAIVVQDVEEIMLLKAQGAELAE